MLGNVGQGHQAAPSQRRSRRG